MPRRTIQQVLSQDPLFGSPPPNQPDQPGPAGLQGPASLLSEAAPAPDAAASAPASMRPRPTAAQRLAASMREPPAPPSKPPAPLTRPRTRSAKPQRPPTARVAVWVRPLLTQVDRIAATGLPPQDVLKAAWRRAVASFAMAPDYVAPSPSERAEGREHCYVTTLTVDAGILEGLVRAHDRLRIKSHWSLVCGQAEPLFWHALDDLLTELEQDHPA